MIVVSGLGFSIAMILIAGAVTGLQRNGGRMMLGIVASVIGGIVCFNLYLNYARELGSDPYGIYGTALSVLVFAIGVVTSIVTFFLGRPSRPNEAGRPDQDTESPR